ncbi:Threonine/homoserine efflux transporter RhtA [Desulfocicer vacuolatum DSM 3385]|uniref:Threonine/homoserine efflux transporter RhtA n=1 Tax=Desulfocicer vacuolatum DSM 3385 TaxID=1121400 RepID=A0A1W1Z0X9_9BACT|nr:DMT family transporter [Desulfocicer vacuolatum]SMC41741.1 Threonine/homoserine efflux transporter RhtA [Desulfocicer vacuolatum DSM 3385]
MSFSIKSALAPMVKPGLRDVHLAVFLFGFSGLFGKFLLCSPVLIVFGRTVFASLFLLPFFLRIRRDNTVPMVMFLAQGALLALHWCTFFISIQISTVAIGLLTFSTFPLFVTFMEPFFFKETLAFKNCVISLVVFVGLVLVIPSFDFSREPVQGAMWGVASGFTFALLGLVNRKNVISVSPIAVSFYQNFFAALFLLPWTVWFVPGISFPTPGELMLLMLLGGVCTALAHSLFIKALVHIKTRTAGVITALEPLYGILMAMIFLGEIPGWRTALGGVIIIGATLVAMTGRD